MRRTWPALAMLLAILAPLSGCSSDDGGSTPSATSTPTLRPSTATATLSPPSTIPATSTHTVAGVTPPSQTPTPTSDETPGTMTPSTSAAVSGLAVLRSDFSAARDDALGAPPAEWSDKPGAADFDRALSFASWTVTGAVGREGETNADGSFRIADLPPGTYQLDLSKTLNGNLLGVTVPFTVGDDGRAELVIEIAQGRVRWSDSYSAGGSSMRETSAPNGGRVVLRDGKIVELDTPGRSYVDADGDGSFDPSDCEETPPLWLCGADNNCGDDRVCSCVGSCPSCEDCRLKVCSSAKFGLYTCGEQRPCVNPGDRCACVSSCPACDDCAASVCVPSCGPVQITGISLSGPARLYLNQSGFMSALAQLTDGSLIDVTQLVEWGSSDDAVVAVDAWGTLTASTVGTAEITATLGDLTSGAWQIEVAERPALRKIYLQNVSCFYPLGTPGVGPDGASPRPMPSGVFLPPDCRQIVRIGGTIQFFALGEFDDNYYEDLTSLVTWQLDPEGIGQVAAGLFTGVAVGTTDVSARFGDVASDPTEIKVVDQPTPIALQIYANAAVTLPGPMPVDPASSSPIPCVDCGYTIAILTGDDLPFQATAAYDTGEWVDVTAMVAWSSSNTSAAPISTAGILHAAAAGDTVVSATFAELTSNSVNVHVVDTATVLSLTIYHEGNDRVVAKGDQVFLHALGYYDVGFDREVTANATWKSSDDSIGGFDQPGVFVGRSAGNAEVWAELEGAESNHIPIEVFQTSSLAYCDDNNINRADWSDAFNRVVLESDCALYTHPEVATLRFTVTEVGQRGGIFDPCLDLSVYEGDRLVRTIREEGCGQPFVAPSAPEYDQAAVRYQTLAFWDLKDDRGSPVPPGAYTIQGRFYLYYDPVISLKIVVSAPNSRIPCEVNQCGNGCGYVHACGDSGPPGVCTQVCTTICECPAGWGITPDGDCEPCAAECCPPGAACLPGTPTCEPPPVCCPDGKECPANLPPCKPRCCPFGALCGPLNLPPCECCPAGAQCDAAAMPCEPPPPCCPRGALCILPLPICPDCCAAGTPCENDLPPCDQTMCCRPDGSCDPNQAQCR